MHAQKIIFALDVDTFVQAEHWVSTLSGHVGMFKVGKQLFTANGPDVVRMVLKSGGRSFSTSSITISPIPFPWHPWRLPASGRLLSMFTRLGGYEMMARTMATLDRDFSAGTTPEGAGGHHPDVIH